MKTKLLPVQTIVCGRMKKPQHTARMKRAKGIFGVAAMAGLLSLGLSGPASATVIMATLSNDFSGTKTVSGDPVVTFDDMGVPGSVKVTADLTNLTTIGEFIGDFWFNFTGNSMSLMFGNFQGPTADPTIQTCNTIHMCANNTFRPGPDGFFDVLVSWAANDFAFGEIFMMDITAAGITAADFNLTSLPGQGQGGSHCVAMHAQGLAQPEGSDFLGNAGPCTVVPDPDPIPEPSVLLLFAMGFLGLGLTRHRSTQT